MYVCMHAFMHACIVATVFASHAVGRGFAPRTVIPKTFIKWYTLPPCLARMR